MCVHLCVHSLQYPFVCPTACVSNHFLWAKYLQKYVTFFAKEDRVICSFVISMWLDFVPDPMTHSPTIPFLPHTAPCCESKMLLALFFPFGRNRNKRIWLLIIGALRTDQWHAVPSESPVEVSLFNVSLFVGLNAWHDIHLYWELFMSM